MIALLVVVALGASTPEQEVEAWDPIADAREAPARPAPDSVDDRATKAWRAAGIVSLGAVVGGVGGGAIAGFGLNAVNTNLPGVAYHVGNVVVIVTAFGFLIAAPIILLAIFADDLPGWAPWAAGATTAVGTTAGLVIGYLLGTAYVFAVARRSGSDCIGCGPESLVGYVVLPIGLALVGATSLGISTTTLATFSE